MTDSHAFRQLMGCFATGITVITAQDAKLGPVGITINSLTSVSLKPTLLLFCLEKDAQLYPTFKTAKTFAVNILGDAQEDVSRYFANRQHNAKPSALWDKPVGDCPVLRGTLGWMICKKVETYKGGDHSIFLGEVLSLKKRAGKREPLLYFHGRYRTLSESP